MIKFHTWSHVPNPLIIKKGWKQASEQQKKRIKQLRRQNQRVFLKGSLGQIENHVQRGSGGYDGNKNLNYTIISISLESFPGQSILNKTNFRSHNANGRPLSCPQPAQNEIHKPSSGPMTFKHFPWKYIHICHFHVVINPFETLIFNYVGKERVDNNILIQIIIIFSTRI